MSRPPMLAADYIRELTQTHATHEQVRQPVQDADGRWRTKSRSHVVMHKALLAQIEETITTSASPGAWGGSSFGSKPAGRIDCLAFLERLDRQSRSMAADHGLSLMPLTPRLTALAGKIGDRTDFHVRAWWATARVLTQHDGPPFAPNVPCLVERCERIGSLRLRLDEKVAVCVECHTVWSEGSEDPTMSFGRLQTWVIWAAEHLGGLRHWRTEDELTGYPGLGYQVECEECRPERLERAKREAARLLAIRAHDRRDTPTRAAS